MDFLLIIDPALQYLYFIIICFLTLSSQVIDFSKVCALQEDIDSYYTVASPADASSKDFYSMPRFKSTAIVLP